VTFEYKYVALTRWLLKVSFNAARQQKSDAASFDDLILYMRALHAWQKRGPRAKGFRT
jgi:hypothetical protein